MKEITSENTGFSPQARAKRLRILRGMTSLSRQDFEERYGISKNTLQSWEDAKRSGLSKRGAVRFLSAVQKEGVFCTLEWLLSGRGNAPQAVGVGVYDAPEFQRPPLSEEEIIAQEIQAFQNINGDALLLMINDDAMEPYYYRDDYVGGKLLTGTQIEKLVGKNCIIELPNGQRLLRYLKATDRPEVYHLVGINPQASSNTQYLLQNQKISKAAEVIWHRRHNPK